MEAPMRRTSVIPNGVRDLLPVGDAGEDKRISRVVRDDNPSAARHVARSRGAVPRFASIALPCLLSVACAHGVQGHAERARDDREAGAGFVENRGADCEVGGIAGPSDAGLPDPFARADGSRIATRADWRCHRQALLRAAEEQVYGWKGPTPDRVDGTIAGDRIDVTVSHGGREVSFSADLRLPAGPGPHPATIVVGGRAGVDDGLLAGEGVARIDFVPTAVGAETGTSRARQGAFFDLYGEQVQGTGTLMAWAWGVSRIIDVLAQAGQGTLRVDAIAVTGCSRYGKGALAAGAFDERVALTIPIESGSGGVPVWRGVVAEGAQPPHSAFGEQPWLGDAFGAFANDVERLPIDQHEVLGLVAPRGLLVLDNPHVDWLGARFGHVSALAGAEIYRALGVGGNIGYHAAVEDGTHCAWRGEWDAAARDAIRRHLRKVQAGDLPIVAAEGKAGSLEDFRAWRTPALH